MRLIKLTLNSKNIKATKKKRNLSECVNMLTLAEADEILEDKEMQIDIVINAIRFTRFQTDREILLLSHELEECADVMYGLELYKHLAESIYGLVNFLRQNTQIIIDNKPLFSKFLDSFIPTLKALRHVLFSYDDINKQGFYASFENDCRMLESFLTGHFNSHQSMDEIFF